MADVVKLGGAAQSALPVKVKAPNGHEKKYELPLRGSLKMADVMLFRVPAGLSDEARETFGFDAFWKFACRYLPEEALGELTEDEYITLYKAWDEASDANGVTQGE